MWRDIKELVKMLFEFIWYVIQSIMVLAMIRVDSYFRIRRENRIQRLVNKQIQRGERIG